MATHFRALAFIATCCLASWAAAGITVSSYRTVAGTNAYAPLSKANYFQQQILENVSPATADATGDWAGTNDGGTLLTWRWLGSAHANSTTDANLLGLNATAAGSFSYDLNTISEFVDPSRTATLYAPGSGANYRCYFSVDTPATYALTIQLNQWSAVTLTSLAAGDIIYEFNIGAEPRSFRADGTLAAGQYQVIASAAYAAPTPLPNGINDVSAGGSFSGFMFSVQVPEPIGVSLAGMVGILLLRRVRRRI